MTSLRDGMTIPIQVRCQCPRPRTTNVRLQAHFWSEMKRMVETHSNDITLDMAVFEYYCRHCRVSRKIRVRDLEILDNHQP